MINNKLEEVGIIYGWYNTLTDMWYVGQTVNPEDRFKTHIRLATTKKDNNKFHNALRKYGLDNFIYCVLEENVLRENLNMREIDWIEYYDSFYEGYNGTVGGQGCIKMSEESRKKISESLKGKHFCYWKGKHLRSETRKKISEANKGKIPWMKGKKHTEETRKKISEAIKDKPLSKETRKKISESLIGHPGYMKGKKHTEEAKRKISEHNKGKYAPNKGKHLSEETRKKISETLKSNPDKSRAKKVIQYDLNNNYINTFNSITEASIKTNGDKNGICQTCKGRRITSGGFIWKYAS